jgi:hypothetical protein
MFTLLDQYRKTLEQTQSAIFELKTVSSFQKTAKKTLYTVVNKGQR